MRRSFAVSLLAALIVGITAGVALADYNYVNNTTMSPTQSLWSTYNSWVTNQVFRPTGNQFCVWFEVSGGNPNAGELCNSNTNPFQTPPGGYGYNRAFCHSNASSDVSPVTCRVYS